MHSHLVAVKVSVEGSTDERMKLNGLAFDKDRLKRLDTEAVKRRRTIEEHRMLANDFFENIPDFRTLFLDELFRHLDSCRHTLEFKFGIDKGFEQLQRHFLR